MKNIYLSVHDNKYKEKKYRKEQKAGGFRCLHCRIWVPFNEYMGTHHRNHCFYCLWSKHVDENTPGDRMSDCYGGMTPVALTYKHTRYKHYPELMVVHICAQCGKISPNRLAADDVDEAIQDVFEESTQPENSVGEFLSKRGMVILTHADKDLVQSQLFKK